MEIPSGQEMTEKKENGTAKEIETAERTETRTGIGIEIRIRGIRIGTIKTRNVSVTERNDAARKKNVARKRNTLVVKNVNVVAAARDTPTRGKRARRRTTRNIALNLEVQNQKWTICLQRREICVLCSACNSLKELELKI